MPKAPKEPHRPWLPITKSSRSGWSNRYDADFYNKAVWRKLSRYILNSQPLCVICKVAPSEHADHIISIRNGGAPLDESNVQGVCRRCHNSKSASEKGGAGVGGENL